MTAIGRFTVRQPAGICHVYGALPPVGTCRGSFLRLSAPEEPPVASGGMTAVVEVVENSRVSARAVAAVPLETAPEVLRALANLSFEPEPAADVVGYVGRNDNWGLTVSGGRQVFVKRLTGAADETAGRLARALDFAELVRAAPPRHWRVAELLGADAEARVMVFEQVSDAVSAGERIDDLDVRLARRIGRAVGELHSMPAGPTAAAKPLSPRVASRLSALTLEEYAQASGAELEAWGLLQHDKQMVRALAGLAERSQAAPQVPSHRDLRLDQILLAGDDIYLVDWEEYRLADPAVDVGSFIGEWLHRAASAMFAGAGGEQTPAEAHESLVQRGARELEVVRPLIMAFWTGYRREYPIDQGLAARATAYAGWHLFDRMLAKSRYSTHLGALDRGIAGIGRNALIGGPEFVATIGLGDA